MRLLTEPVLIVRQEWRALRRPPDYDVFDRNWEPVATARYAADDELKPLLAAYGLRHRTADALLVSDLDGVLVFTVVFPGFRARAVMLVRDGEGRDIGHAVKAKGFLKVRYDLTIDGRPAGAIQAMDRRQRLVMVTDHTGEEVATIRTGAEEAPFEMKDGEDGYYLETVRPMPNPLHRLVVACTVALQAAIGSESSVGETVVFRVGLLPARFDRLRRRSRP